MSEIQSKQGVTVLGLGPMGRALAGVLASADHPTTVWNRTPGKAEELAERGVSVATTVAAAVAASPTTIISVLNNDVADELLRASAGVLAGRTVINLTCDAPARSRSTAAWVTGQGARYLDGAIMKPSYTIGTDAAALLFAGPAALFEQQRSTLSALGGAIVHLGQDQGRAAAYDVALLDLFWTTMSGITHSLALARAEQIEPNELLPHALGLVEILPAIMTDLAERTESTNHTDGTSSIRSAATAMAHIAQASRDRGLDDGVVRAALAVAERAITDGHGDDELSRLVETIATGQDAPKLAG